MTKNATLVDHLKTDYTNADLTLPQRVMLDYAVKLTESPAFMEASDVKPLKEAGFDDKAILDINQIVAYFAYVNRVADGLGVELEDFWEEK